MATRSCIGFASVLVAAFAIADVRVATAEETAPRLATHESYVQELLRDSALRIDDPKAVFAFVLDNLPQQVKVYPTENYYYFRFVHQGAQYAGNIRLDAETRDHGKVHIAYSIDFAEWKDEDPAFHRLLGQSDGVLVEKLAPLIYRVSLGARSVVFELNDLSAVAPPPTAIAADERYIGPVFDESAVRFFLVYNQKLKLFHYILDETIPPTDIYDRAPDTDRILIGKRTGFAFYRDHRLERKILIGVFEGNARVNNYFDGPFDQLPDNFIKGEDLRSALLEIEPKLAGQIDRFGADPNGDTRFMIGPYLHYRSAEDLMIFHRCAESKEIAPDLYYACFLVEPEYDATTEPPAAKKPKARTKKMARPARSGSP